MATICLDLRSRSQRFFHGEIPFVERASDDYADNSGSESGTKRTKVVEARDSARRDDGEADGTSDFCHPRRIDPDLCAVAGDIGYDRGGDSRRAESIRRLSNT